MFLMQEYDLLAFKVKDPTTFGAKTFKFLTWQWSIRQGLLKQASQFCIVHILTNVEGKAEEPEVTFGPKYSSNDDQGL